MAARIRRVGIVVPTADAKRDMPRRCLEIVRETTKGFEVDLQVVESSGPEFRFSRSINRGLRAAPDADAWVLLNDDAWMDPGWLDALVATAEAHPRAGIVGSVLRFPGGGIQFAGGYIPLTPAEMLVAGIRHRAPLWALRKVRAKGWREDPYMYAHWHRAGRHPKLDFVTAACLLITRDCYQKTGGYDEDYLFGNEDIDHSLRALEAGFELAMSLRATGVHHEGASGREMGARQQESDRVFRAKWPASRIRAAARRPDRAPIFHG